MAQANYTPIQLYRSTTASAAPAAGNLADGELAINTNDGKLYYKDSSGVVQVIASKAGASGDVVGPASATDNAVVRFDGTTGKLVQNSVVTIADSTGDVAGVGALSMSGNLTLSGGTANGVLYLNGSKVATSGSALTFDGTNLAISTGKVTTSTAGASAGFQWGGTTTTSRLYDDGSGNAYLDIGVGASNSSVPLFIRTKGASGIVYVQPNGVNAYVVEPANQIWSISGSEAMRLDSTGLGIGTSSPVQKLEVANTSGSVAATLRSSNSGYSELYFADVADNAAGAISYEHTSNILRLYNGGSARVYLDSSGNLGLGVTPSAWGGSYKGLQVAATGVFASNGLNGTTLAHNAYYDGTNDRYLTTGAASRVFQFMGGIRFDLAASGNAGDPITFTQAMTLDASGNLFVGATALGSNANYFAFSPGNAFGDFGHGTGVASATPYTRFLLSGSAVGSIDQSGTTGIALTSASQLVFNAGGSERARITSGGNLDLQNNIGLGGAAATTSGTGITFPATQSASSNANTLDDYEEGTWTPVLGGSTGTSGQTYSLQTGRYTKIGRQVICSFEATLTAVGTVSNTAVISGLPFTAGGSTSNIDNGGCLITFASGLATNQLYVTGFLYDGETRVGITGISTAGTAIGGITATNIWGNTTRISGVITYIAS